MPVEELRLALVLNGGVSLAVWMGGVTHELDLLRRAASAEEEEDSHVRLEDRELWKMWRSAAGEKRVVIDVIAGSSAGGINGALLATAIARGAALDPGPDRPGGKGLRDVWEETAGLGETKLMKPPNGDGYPTSILNGEVFKEEIDRAIDNIKPGGRPVDPVTLFLTATVIGAADMPYTDAYRHGFVVADHRRLYRFEADEEKLRFNVQEKQFEKHPATDFEAYANELKAATRATASFPVAFSPVQEVGKMPGRLQVRPVRDAKPAWLADGGIMDNAPFGPVLDRITRRPSDAAFTRLLLYIVPSRGNAPAPIATNGEPAWPQVVQAAVSLPRESDFRDDIEELDGLLRTGDTTSADAQAMFQKVIAGDADDVMAAADVLLPAYRRGRLAGGIWDVQVGAGAEGPRVLRRPGVDDTTLSDEAIDELAPRWIDLRATSVRDVPQGPWRWGLTPAERCLRLMSRDLQRRMGSGEDGPTHDAARELGRKLRCLEALRDHVDGAVARLATGDVAEPPAAVTAVNAILAEVDIERTVENVMAEADAAYRSVTTIPESVGSALVAAFAVEVCARALNARAPFQRTAPFTFLRVGPDAPAAVLSGSGLSGVRPDELAGFKLYGTRAWHFAAFGKAAWRRRDWLWGRLDAVTHLAGPLGLSDATVLAMQEEILRSEGVTRKTLIDDLEDMRKVTGNAAFLQKVEKEEQGRAIVESLTDKVLDLLANTDKPKAIGGAGRIASAVLRSKYRRLPHSRWWRYRSLRLLRWPIRRRIRSWIRL